MQFERLNPASWLINEHMRTRTVLQLQETGLGASGWKHRHTDRPHIIHDNVQQRPPRILQTWTPPDMTTIASTDLCPSKRSCYERDCNKRTTLWRHVPSSRSSTARLTPLSNARASACVWNVRPNRFSSVFQWWKVGLALMYCTSFLSAQFSTTWCRKGTRQQHDHFVTQERRENTGIWGPISANNTRCVPCVLNLQCAFPNGPHHTDTTTDVGSGAQAASTKGELHITRRILSLKQQQCPRESECAPKMTPQADPKEWPKDNLRGGSSGIQLGLIQPLKQVCAVQCCVCRPLRNTQMSSFSHWIASAPESHFVRICRVLMQQKFHLPIVTLSGQFEFSDTSSSSDALFSWLRPGSDDDMMLSIKDPRQGRTAPDVIECRGVS